MTDAVLIDTTLPCTPDPRGLGGLLALVDGVERPLPLRAVKVRAAIVGTVCRTVVDLHYQNPHPHPVDVVHLFPLPEDGAVVEVTLVAGDLTVRAECREKSEAERIYAEARVAGHRAVLLTAERPDIHTLRATRVPPNEAISVRVVVVEALVVEDGRAQWRFPTTIAPRYLPGTPTSHLGPGVHPDTDHAPDASRLSPPLRLAGGTPLDLEVTISGKPSSITSALHAVRLDLADGIRVAPSGHTSLNKDFVLSVGWEEEQGTGVRAWTDGKHTLVHVVPPITTARSLPRDAVFVVDISGSMGGTKMDAARRALKSALHGLVPGDRFRLVAFDDRVEHFRPAYTDYDDRSVALADRWIAGLEARGGTEMLAPLVAAFAGPRVEGRVTTVLFITDGQVYNDQELIAAVAGRRNGAILHTLGIDTAVNAALLKGLARMGGGSCTLCTPADDIEATMARIEARFGSPVLRELTVEGETARPDPQVLFAGMPARFLIRGAPAEVRVRGEAEGGAWSATGVPARIETDLGALWARERVAWLEDRLAVRPFEEEAIRAEVIRIALAHGIASRYTAFVAVERSRVIGGTPVEIVQPVERPDQWADQEAGHVGGGSVRRAPGGSVFGAPPAPPPPPMVMEASPMMAPARDEGRAASPRRQAPSPIDAMARKVKAAFGMQHERAEADAAPEPTGSADAILAASQSADGSFGGDVRRTVAALVALVLLGHTRRRGLRKRTVAKAAAWLIAHATDRDVARALALLNAAEAGQPLDRNWSHLHGAGPEGAELAALT